LFAVSFDRPEAAWCEAISVVCFIYFGQSLLIVSGLVAAFEPVSVLSGCSATCLNCSPSALQQAVPEVDCTYSFLSIKRGEFFTSPSTCRVAGDIPYSVWR